MRKQNLKNYEFPKKNGDTKELIARIQSRLDWYFEDIRHLRKIQIEQKTKNEEYAYQETQLKLTGN